MFALVDRSHLSFVIVTSITIHAAQLSWNYNYGAFSNEYCGDPNVLLENPDWVATNPTLAWASSLWFWYSGGACDREGGERCKPSPRDVFTGAQKLCPADESAQRRHGLGWAVNVVNGGLECGSGAKCDYRVYSRVRKIAFICVKALRLHPNVCCCQIVTTAQYSV